MMVLCPKSGSFGFYQTDDMRWDEISEMVPRFLLHRQLWVSNLSKVGKFEPATLRLQDT